MIDTENENHAVSYSCCQTPSGYSCGKCGRGGIKLWRQYQTFLDHSQLLCADCAAADQSEGIEDIDESGRRSSEFGGRTDQIGWYVPAVPTEDGDSYWGYTSVPEDGVNWWRRLPTR